MRSLVFFGSNVASLVHRNPYTSFPNEFERFLRKNDPSVYMKIFSRCESEVVKSKHAKASHKSLVADVNKMSSATSTVGDTQAARGHVEKMVAPLAEGIGSKIEATSKDIDTIDSLVQDLMEFVPEESKERVASQPTPEKKLEAAIACDGMNAAVRERLRDLRDARVKKSSERNDLRLEKERVDIVSRDCTSKINTTFGVRYEGNTLDTFSKDYGFPVSTPRNTFVKEFGEIPGECTLSFGGKIDGYIEGTHVNGSPCVVEIKNRVKKFFNVLTEYEKVQIMTYMYITDTPQCFLVQTLKTNNSMNMVDLYEMDQEWFDTFTESVLSFARAYVRFIADESAHDEYTGCRLTEDKETMLKGYGF